MAISRSKFYMAYIVTLCFVLVACSGGWKSIPAIVSPDFSLESTDNFDDINPEPTAVRPTPTPTRQPAVTTAAPTLDKFRTKQITEQPVAGAYWSEDGQSVVYATWGEHQGIIKDWWKYDTSTGNYYLIQPPFDLNSQIWERLAASYVNETFIWFGGGLSPSGARVVYNHLPPGYSSTPDPDDFSLRSCEVWTARSDGSEAIKLQDCPGIIQAIWFDHERKVLLSCSYEGAAEVSVANVDGSSHSLLLGGLSVSHQIALSPDEKKLAFPDTLGTLGIAFIDGGEIRQISRWGYMPNWSPDSRRLYYQHLEKFGDYFAEIRVYDLDSGTDTLLIPSPEYTSDGTGVSIPVGIFAVSPLENAAVFENRGLWLVTWFP